MRLCSVFRHMEYFSRCVQLIRARIVVTESILLRTKVSGVHEKSHGQRVRSNTKFNVFAFESTRIYNGRARKIADFPVSFGSSVSGNPFLQLNILMWALNGVSKGSVFIYIVCMHCDTEKHSTHCCIAAHSCFPTVSGKFISEKKNASHSAVGFHKFE